MKKYIFIFTILLVFVTNSLLFAQFTKTVVGVTGSTLSYTTKKPVSVKINVYDNTGKKINSTKSNAHDNGYYFVTSLSAGTTYYFEIADSNFLNERFEVVVPNTNKYLEISRDFLIIPNDHNTQIKLNISPFERNKSKLKPGSAFILNDIIATLKYNNNTKFKLICYADYDKDPKSNNDLSRNRAQSILDYLQINGIDISKFTIEAKSSTDNLFPPPTEKRAKGKRYIGPTYFIID